MFGNASDQSGLQSLEPLPTLGVDYNPQSISDLPIPPTGNVLGTGRLCWSLSPEPSVVDHSMYADQAEINSSSSQALWHGLHNGLMDGYVTNQSTGKVTRGTSNNNHPFVDGPSPLDMEGSKILDTSLPDWKSLGSLYTWSDVSSLAEFMQEPRCYEHGCEGRRFSSMSNLRRHQRERNRLVRRMTCPWCGASFYRKWTINQHVLRGSCRRPGEIDFWQAYAAAAALRGNIKCGTDP
jgi:hypothetical protein